MLSLGSVSSLFSLLCMARDSTFLGFLADKTSNWIQARSMQSLGFGVLKYSCKLASESELSWIRASIALGQRILISYKLRGICRLYLFYLFSQSRWLSIFVIRIFGNEFCDWGCLIDLFCDLSPDVLNNRCFLPVILLGFVALDSVQGLVVFADHKHERNHLVDADVLDP